MLIGKIGYFPDKIKKIQVIEMEGEETNVKEPQKQEIIIMNSKQQQFHSIN